MGRMKIQVNLKKLATNIISWNLIMINHWNGGMIMLARLLFGLIRTRTRVSWYGYIGSLYFYGPDLYFNTLTVQNWFSIRWWLEMRIYWFLLVPVVVSIGQINSIVSTSILVRRHVCLCTVNNKIDNHEIVVFAHCRRISFTHITNEWYFVMFWCDLRMLKGHSYQMYWSSWVPNK